MIEIESLKQIIVSWAKTLPYKVKIHVFGSFLKGKKNPTDIDISLELLHTFSKVDRTLLWSDHHSEWEDYLSQTIGYTIHLCLFEGANSPKMMQNLKDGSLLLYDANEREIGT